MKISTLLQVRIVRRIFSCCWLSVHVLTFASLNRNLTNAKTNSSTGVRSTHPRHQAASPQTPRRPNTWSMAESSRSPPSRAMIRGRWPPKWWTTTAAATIPQRILRMPRRQRRPRPPSMVREMRSTWSRCQSASSARWANRRNPWPALSARRRPSRSFRWIVAAAATTPP